ncbi:putative ring-cleavage extradiol dioxygenase [Mycolicibacterium mageritense DSM 44476 = CIP 104973]|uniref:Biphenyl-2,3-diol 1,2-dioxygenase III n=1 Tax=Mycolicibacterium mageritense TaxID=53462 RepID=A0ABM7HPC2_MYCME|nr:VOC family protein [Mycolicibacterium mageritense]MCC9180618.1 VOC family protein [Mycolicibacterium mageritense]BBX32368.1 putative biphenyl-2,3-diol 1,2-dioxygenase III [Mycolicibacterium mageritense]GJJ20677.1 putative biphenyl-2,3-diol 1,2-dioxygenase III [Mycolicibacterium mageritense]CDO23089.1 putative biphenyl-2,3-diol 1,2-dioxygenase III [Mycolicibacterium mageritense DSM 44476 = CIP 104973]
MEQHVTPAAGEPAGIASPARLAHVVLRTTQYDAVVAWYKLVLGARVQFEASGKISFLTYDDEHHRIAVVNVPTLADRPPMAIGVDHIAFTYNSMCDLVDTYERLKAASVRPYWTINHGPTISFYYRDPDNNQIELQVDNFATNDDVNEFLAAEFPTNPIGVEFDPDEFVRMFRDGVPEAELRKRPDIGPIDIFEASRTL